MRFFNMREQIQLNYKEQAVLDRILTDEASENYFFKKVAHVKWFYHLKDKGFFSPDKAPGPQAAREEGYFTLPEWNILSYLELIAEQVEKSECGKEYADELLEIMADVTNYCQGKEELDNYRTWWFFAKILSRIPTDRYSVDYLDHVDIWLQSRFNNSLVVSEVTEKLIPKLLKAEHPDAVLKAEKLIGSITEFYLVDRNYRFRSDVHWINQFFKTNSELIAEKCSPDIILNLSTKIRKILERQVASRSITLGTKIIDVELTNSLQNYRVVFNDSSGEGEEQREVCLEKVNFELFVKDLNDFIKTTIYPDYIPEQTEKYLWALYNDLYNAGSLQSLYDIDDEDTQDSLQSATGILKKLLLDMLNFKPKEISKIVNEYFHSPYMYFVKMALYIIGMTETKYLNLFWKALASNNSSKIFDSLYVEDELRHVLKGLKKTSAKNRELLIKLIEAGPKYCWESENKDIKQYVTIWKQERYQALSHLPEFTVKHSELKKVTGYDVALHPAVGRIQTRWGWGDSPLTPEEVLAMPNKNLAAFLKEFKTKDRWNGPTVSALAQTLENVAKQSPEKFINDLSPFLESGYLHVYYILFGVQQGLSENKNIDWNNILFFIQQYTHKPDFWNDKYKISDDDDWNADHKWIINITCELIKSGTNDDKKAIPEEFFNKVYLIIFDFAKKLNIENEKIVNDPVTHILNSVWGKLLTALLYTSLRQARINKTKLAAEEVRWDSTVKETYDDCFKRDSQDIYILFGYYLAQFYYLDREWASNNLSIIFKSELEFRNLFLLGYLNNLQIYADVFKEMSLFYDRAISEISTASDREKLATHLSTGYLYSLNKTANKLFFKFAEEGTAQDIHNIIFYFWSQREDSSSSIKPNKRKKIIEFWKWLYERAVINNKFDTDRNKLLADTVMLAKYLDEISEQSAIWMEAAAEFAEEYYKSYLLVEIMDQLKDKGDRAVTGRFIARIFRRMLNETLPGYDRNHLRSIFQFLLETDDYDVQELVSEIYDIYLRKGSEIFVDIWNEVKVTQ